LAGVLDLTAQLKPRVIVEIGCDRGGTLYAWRQLCNRVYGITLPVNDWTSGGQEGYPLDSHGAIVLKADSHDPASRHWLVKQLRGAWIDVLHIDGDHSYVGVRADYAEYSPLVRSGGLVLIHDVLNIRDPRVDVPRFWAEIGGRGRVIAQRTGVPLGFGVLEME
jgi:cephalosporin hydroxylase